MESLTFYRLLIYRVNNKHIKITNILSIFQDIVDYTGDKGLEFPCKNHGRILDLSTVYFDKMLHTHENLSQTIHG